MSKPSILNLVQDSSDYDFAAVVEYIHQEIASQGTASEFIGHGLDIETGEYDADEMAKAILDSVE